MASDPTPLTPAEIAELRRMEKAATPGALICGPCDPEAFIEVGTIESEFYDAVELYAARDGFKDEPAALGDLLAALRNKAPALLDAAEKYPAVQSMLRDAREELARVRTAHGVSIAALETATAEAAKLRELASASPVWTDSMSNSVRADRDRLAAEVERLRGLCNKQQDRLEESLAENRKLREAVEEYADHRGTCPATYPKPMPCECGYEAKMDALAAIRERAGQETEATA